MTSRMKKIERSKLHTLLPTQVNELRQRQQEENEASRKRWRQRHQKRSQWGKNEYVDDDFVSRMLVKWTRGQLIQYTKILLLLINRRTEQPVVTNGGGGGLSKRLNSLIHYRYPSEYYETLFADFTLLDEGRLSFRAHYNRVYREAVADESQENRLYHVAQLRTCFLVALTYDARVRRFVFSKHDIHYEYMQTHPPPLRKTTHYIERMRPLVDQFLEQNTDATTVSDQACAVWISCYMFLLE